MIYIASLFAVWSCSDLYHPILGSIPAGFFDTNRMLQTVYANKLVDVVVVIKVVVFLFLIIIIIIIIIMIIIIIFFFLLL